MEKFSDLNLNIKFVLGNLGIFIILLCFVAFIGGMKNFGPFLAGYITALFSNYILAPSLVFLKEGKWSHPKNSIIAEWVSLSFLLVLLFMWQSYSPIISSIEKIQDIFILTLTFILVYATFSLLIFTYVLVLKSVKNEYITIKKISKDIIEKSIMIGMKSGLSFLLATIFSVIGYFLFYIGLILIKLDFGANTIQINNFIQQFGLYQGYYLIALYIILISLYLFIYGIKSLFDSLKCFN